jgi:hypothetical protein
MGGAILAGIEPYENSTDNMTVSGGSGFTIAIPIAR